MNCTREAQARTFVKLLRRCNWQVGDGISPSYMAQMICDALEVLNPSTKGAADRAGPLAQDFRLIAATLREQRDRKARDEVDDEEEVGS